jgi:hypothetical protein
VVGLTTRTTNERRSNTMKTYLLRNSNPVEPQKAPRSSRRDGKRMRASECSLVGLIRLPPFACQSLLNRLPLLCYLRLWRLDAAPVRPQHRRLLRGPLALCVRNKIILTPRSPRSQTRRGEQCAERDQGVCAAGKSGASEGATEDGGERLECRPQETGTKSKRQGDDFGKTSPGGFNNGWKGRSARSHPQTSDARSAPQSFPILWRLGQLLLLCNLQRTGNLLNRCGP